MNAEAIKHTLRKSQAFQGLSPDVLGAVASVSTEAAIAPGEALIREGDLDRDLIILVSGDAHASRAAEDGSEIRLNDIAVGECIGEIAFFDTGPRSASVVADSECRAIRIHVEDLDTTPPSSS